MSALRTTMVALVVLLGSSGLSRAQVAHVSTEADVTVGISTEETARMASTQLRLFGEAPARVQFTVEGTWADTTGFHTDAFGTAYPYQNRVQVTEAFVQRLFTKETRILAVRAGQYRTPFGLSSRSDQGYIGFLRAPLVRYEGYWSVSNNFLDRGVDIVGGVRHVMVEASVATAHDMGVLPRQPGVNTSVRAQVNVGPATFGISRVSSSSYRRRAGGRLGMTGLDGRVMVGGVQVRGEWMVGRPWEGTATSGGYLDVIVHRPFMGPVTAVIRTERLTYESSRSFRWMDEVYTDWNAHRHTVGARVRLPHGLVVQAGVVGQGEEMGEYFSRPALDFALTYSVRNR